MTRLVFLTLAAGIASAAAQPSGVINGKVEPRALAGPLAQEFHKLEASAASPLWAAYSFPAVPGQGTMCGIDQHNNIVRLEGQDTLLVLFRFDNARSTVCGSPASIASSMPAAFRSFSSPVCRHPRA